MLIDAGDALAPALAVGDCGRWLAAKADFPAVGLAKPGEDADQGRLAGAVASDKGVRFAGQNTQARIGERDGRAIALRDADRFGDRNRLGPGGPGRTFRRRRLDHLGATGY